MSSQVQSALGLALLLFIAWALGERRKPQHWRFLIAGLGLQFALAVLFLELPITTGLFAALNRAVLGLQAATEAGTAFVFGYLGGAALPFQATGSGSSFVFAFRILPLAIFVSALAALLSYWRVLPLIVRLFAALFERTLGVGGAVAVSSAANIFLGMVEAPILVRPYIERLTRSELFIVMCTGLAGVAGTVFVLYATMLAATVPNVAGHLLTASIITVPAAIVIARLMIPETGTPTTGTLALDRDVHGPIDALAQGTRQGLELFLNVLATLIVFVALVYLANAVLGLLPPVGGGALTLERVAGWMFAPIAWMLGVPWQEAPTVGALLGIKTVLNELLAYDQLTRLAATELSDRSRLLSTYALCGFANFGSVGILIAGLCTLAPARRAEITQLGLRSLIGGTLATCTTAAMVGILT